MIHSEYSESLKALEKAANAIENAEYDLKGGFVLATANRAYYGCYYCMMALLSTQNVYAKTHQGVRAKFSELFIKTGIFSIAISDNIALIFEYRQEADYDFDADITPQIAKELISKAREFYQLSKDYLQKLTTESDN
ncbi:MAG TPA: HEPN domain-containing protein [Puia sp.]|nr:HEPN domain-containing protein [Puia sp.]